MSSLECISDTIFNNKTEDKNKQKYPQIKTTQILKRSMYNIA